VASVPAPSSGAMDKQQWLRLSPLLDDLLDASEAARHRRIEELHAQAPADAEALRALLGYLAEVDAGFLAEPAPPPMTGHPGQIVGAYCLERPLGQGGMGIVWLARRADGRFDGLVAIKFVNLDLMTPGGLDRFASEGRLLARLSHPNIARLIDAGVCDEQQPYLVLEYVDGLPIDRFCQQEGLDLNARLTLFAAVLAAVAHAHARFVLHGDIKPGNIMVDRQGDVKLLDFGIAKLMVSDQGAGESAGSTRSAAQAFTPGYAAPEQVDGEPLSAATDVFALGVLLQRLTGLAPGDMSPLAAAGQLPALAKAARGDLPHIVAKALQPAPAERYAHAGDFAADLSRLLRHLPVRARNRTASYVASRFVRRHWMGVSATVAVSAAIAFASLSYVWEAQHVRLQRERAESLVEYMLGDLRRKLQAGGRLELLDGVAAEVMRYYDREGTLAQADADSLGRRARALHLIGEIRDKRGQPAQALAAFQEAAHTTAALLARAPKEGQRVFDHAQSVFWLGNMELGLGRTVQAENAMNDYLALARRLVELDSARADWQMELAYASEAVGVLQLQGGRAAEALHSLETARTVQTRLAAMHPEQRIELARTLGWIADAQLAREDLHASLQALQDKEALLSEAPDHPDDRIVQEQRAIMRSSMGGLERLFGHLEAAQLAREDAMRRYEALVAHDPSNLLWLANLSAIRIGVSENLADRGNNPAALEALHCAELELDRARAESAVETPRHRFILARAMLLRTRLANGTSLASTAARAQAFLADLHRQPGEQRDIDLRQVTAMLQMALGDLLGRAGQQAAARMQWEDLVQRLRVPGIEGTQPEQIALAQALFALGRSTEAAEVTRAVLKTPYRPPELTHLLWLTGMGGTP
jgi:tetratricopeptide (TPR) repeat protein